MFGIASLLRVDYRPALADLPDQKGWRTKADADYGPLNTFARGKLDLGKVQGRGKVVKWGCELLFHSSG